MMCPSRRKNAGTGDLAVPRLGVSKAIPQPRSRRGGARGSGGPSGSQPRRDANAVPTQFCEGGVWGVGEGEASSCVACGVPQGNPRRHVTTLILSQPAAVLQLRKGRMRCRPTPHAGKRKGTTSEKGGAGGLRCGPLVSLRIILHADRAENNRVPLRGGKMTQHEAQSRHRARETAIDAKLCFKTTHRPAPRGRSLHHCEGLRNGGPMLR